MQTFSFSFVVDKHIEDLDEIDTLYGKCADASLESISETTLIHFDRKANTLDEALRSALEDLRQFNYNIQRIEVEPECIGIP